MESEAMTRAYYWRIIGKTSITARDKKLLDTDEEMPENLESKLQLIGNFDFENSFYNDSSLASSGKKSVVMNKDGQRIVVPVGIKNNGSPAWYRAYVKVFPKEMVWAADKQTLFGITLKKGNEEIKTKVIRPQRIADSNKWQEVYVDIYAPAGTACDSVEVFFENVTSRTSTYFDDLKIMRASKNE